MSNYKFEFSPPFSSKTYPVIDVVGLRTEQIDKIWRCQVCNEPLINGGRYKVIVDREDHGIAYTCVSEECVQMRMFQLL